METHNCESSHEHGIAMSSWAGAYRFYVMKHGSVGPGKVQQGGVPILQHGQDGRNPNFWMSYGNEERKYCVTTVWVIEFLNKAEANLPQDLLPDQAYSTFATVRTQYFFQEGEGYRTSSPKVRR